MRFHPRSLAPVPRIRSIIVGCVVVATLAAGCTSHATPSPSSSTLSGSASTRTGAAEPTGADASGPGSALAGLRHQAELAAGRSFTATYSAKGLDQHGDATSSTMRVYRTPSAARIDIAEADATVRILVTPKGTFSCTMSSGSAPLCVELAEAGQSLSPSLATTLQLELLFTSAPSRVADTDGLRVAFAADRPAKDGAPAASCYAIVSSLAGSEVAPGTYCYANGLLVSADFHTGSLEVRNFGGAPDASDFTLPASPVPLPTTTPTATTTPS